MLDVAGSESLAPNLKKFQSSDLFEYAHNIQMPEDLVFVKGSKLMWLIRDLDK